MAQNSVTCTLRSGNNLISPICALPRLHKALCVRFFDFMFVFRPLAVTGLTRAEIVEQNAHLQMRDTSQHEEGFTNISQVFK